MAVLTGAFLLPLFNAFTPGLSDDWAPQAVHAYAAWETLKERNIEPGAGVVIAHIDTGVSAHPELAGSNIQWEKAYNFIDDTILVYHRFSRFQFPPHGHGTETLSTMASPPGCPDETKTGPCVTGIAPAATFLPLLVSDNSIIGSGKTVARAVDYAVKAGAHIINISLGNIAAMPELERAIKRAKEDGVIVVVAAGNSTGQIKVYPGAYEAAIAVGGSTPEATPWEGSSWGTHVAWSAPAFQVYAAFTEKKNTNLFYDVKLAAGTSDATAITSGIAALWLSYHGRDALVARYGKPRLVELFRELVRTRGVERPENWPTSKFGAGIINAQKLLQAELTE